MSDGILSYFVNEKKGIRENIAEQYIEFYIAGYTKRIKGQPVQPNHATLFADATLLNGSQDQSESVSNKLFPFGQENSCSEVILEPEPNNPYDPHAILVYVKHPLNIIEYNKATKVRTREKLLLGYVPMAISKRIHSFLDRFEKGWIKRTRSIHDDKYCSTKVAIPWNIAAFEEDDLFFDRLNSIIGEQCTA